MGLFDDVEDPLGEVGDALADLGAPDAANSLENATQVLQAAIGQNGGLPTLRSRFLIGSPQPNTIPTDQADWEDALKQAGQILDNLGAAGYGTLGAAILGEELPPGWGLDQLNEQPIHEVDALYVEEGLSRPWRAFVTVSKPTFDAYVPPAGQPAVDVGQVVEDAFTDGGAPGYFQNGGGLLPTLDPTDVAEFDALRNLVNNATSNAVNRNTLAGQISQAQDPDAIDPARLPLDHTSDRTTPDRYLGQFARVSLARRLPINHLTLNERWFSGVVTGFEDLGLREPGYRQVRLTIRPRFWQLSLRRRYRIFKKLNAVQIVLFLLDEHGIYPDVGKDDPSPTGRRLAPGGRELFGPLGVPDALTSAVDKIAGAVPFGLGEDVGGAINDALEQPVEDWRPTREYCVQYGETDLEFVERLLAEEGLTYFFENKERRETLVICEDPRLGGKKVLTAGRLPLASPSVRNLSESAWNFAVARVPVPSGVTLRDRSYARPYDPTDLKAGEALDLLSPTGLSSLTTAGGLEQLANQAFGLATELAGTPGAEDYGGPEAQWFEWPAGLSYPANPGTPIPYDAYDGPPAAQLRLEGFRATGAIARGSSDCATLAPGTNARLDGVGFDVLHPAVQKPQRFLITSVTHDARRVAGAFTYSNRFDALNIGIAYRPPPPRARPRIAGVQTAMIVDVNLGDDPTAPSPEVNTEPVEHAWRVRVRFPWERGDAPDGQNGSPWLRFASPLSGAGFGALFVPRVGMEVVVGFDEGDPDRPYVLGAVYNAVHQGAGTRHATSRKPARPDGDRVPGRIDAPARRTEAVLISRSWPQADLGENTRGNQLRFDDYAGNERLRVYAQRDLAEEIGEDHVTSVLENQVNEVWCGGQRETVGGDQTLLVRYPIGDEGDLDCVDAGRTARVTGDEEVEIGGGSKKKKEDEDAEPAEPKLSWLMHDEIEHSDTTTVGTGGRLLHTFQLERIEIEGEGATPDRPARLLRVTKDSKVTIEGNDELRVRGDRRVLAKKKHSVVAATVDIKTLGPKDAGGRAEETGGLTVDEDGVSMSSSGTLSLETKAFTATSGADRVLVKGETKIWIHDGEDNHVLLDAESKTISINGRAGTVIRFGTEQAYIALTQNEILLRAGESKWVTSLASDGTLSELSGAVDGQTSFEATDEILIDAPLVEIGQPPAGGE